MIQAAPSPSTLYTQPVLFQLRREETATILGETLSKMAEVAIGGGVGVGVGVLVGVGLGVGVLVGVGVTVGVGIGDGV